MQSRANASAFERLQREVARNRVQLTDFLKSYDPLNHKRITRSQFQRALQAAGTQVEPTDVEVIVQPYLYHGDEMQVEYRRFLNDLECLDIEEQTFCKNGNNH